MSTKRLLSALCFVAAVVMIAPAIVADPPAAKKEAPKQEASPAPDEADKQVEAFLTERRDTLRQLVEDLEQRYRAGMLGTRVSILQAKNDLLDAELDLAKTRQQRVAVREEVVVNLKAMEKAAEYQGQYGVGANMETYYRTKAARLKAEAELVREKTAPDGSTPRVWWTVR